MGLLTADPDILQGSLVQSKLHIACPQQSDPSVKPGIQVPKGRVHRITSSPGSSHRSLGLRPCWGLPGQQAQRRSEARPETLSPNPSPESHAHLQGQGVGSGEG